MEQQRHLGLPGDGCIINRFAHVIHLFTHRFFARLIGCHRHLIFNVFNTINILGVFGCQLLLGLAGCFAAQADDSIFDLNLGFAAAHVPMEQESGFHFFSEPRIRVCGGGRTFDRQPVVHAFDPGQSRYGLPGQSSAGFFGDDPRQGDHTIFGLDVNVIALEVGLEHIRVPGGRFDAVIRLGCEHRDID